MENRKDFEKYVQEAIRFCQYRERCTSEIAKKLSDTGASTNVIPEIIRYLSDIGAVNDKRFATVYTVSKVFSSRWGKNKVFRELRIRKISNEIIREVFENLDDEKYIQTLVKSYRLKWKESGKISDVYLKRKKVIAYLISRGFEYELIKDIKDIAENDQ